MSSRTCSHKGQQDLIWRFTDYLAGIYTDSKVLASNCGDGSVAEVITVCGGGASFSTKCQHGP